MGGISNNVFHCMFSLNSRIRYRKRHVCVFSSTLQDTLLFSHRWKITTFFSCFMHAFLHFSGWLDFQFRYEQKKALLFSLDGTTEMSKSVKTILKLTLLDHAFQSSGCCTHLSEDKTDKTFDFLKFTRVHEKSILDSTSILRNGLGLKRWKERNF